MQHRLEILADLWIGHGSLNALCRALNTLARSRDIFNRYFYIRHRLAIPCKIIQQLVHTGSRLIHAGGHLREVTHHRAHIALIVHRHTGHRRRHDLQVRRDITHIQRNIDHGVLDLRIAQHLIERAQQLLHLANGLVQALHHGLHTLLRLSAQGIAVLQTIIDVCSRQRLNAYELLSHHTA